MKKMENEKKWISFDLLNNEKILFDNSQLWAYYFNLDNFNIFKTLDKNTFKYFLVDKNVSGNVVPWRVIGKPNNIIEWFKFIFDYGIRDDLETFINDFKDSDKNIILLTFLENAKSLILGKNVELKTLEEIINEWNK